MSFLWIEMLWLLLLLPLLVLIYVLLQQRRKKFALRYASLSLVKDALGRGPGVRRHIPAALLLLCIAVMLFALSRPAATITLPSQHGTVILTIDVSGSMRAEDLKPNRIEAAKSAARAFVEKQPRRVRIGVVSFSAHAALVQTPTADRAKVLAAINRLKTQRGTAVGSGILTSLDAIFEKTGEDPPQPAPVAADDSELEQITPRTYAPAAVVLLSDGQSNQGPPVMEIAQKASDLGVRVYTVGVGSSQGGVIAIRGRSIRVRLDEDSLKAVADETNGAYFKADSETDLYDIYETLSSDLVFETGKTELTAVFTGFAILVLLAAGILSQLWLNRLP